MGVYIELESHLPDTIFSNFAKVKYEGPKSTNPLSYQFYDADRVVFAKPLKEHLRFAVAYWHSFAMTASDPFGSATINRPWMVPGDPIALAKVKADAAFDFFRVLDVPFFCFHDADIAPAEDTLSGCLRNLHIIGDFLEEKISQSETKLLWGTANLFSHPRFMAGHRPIQTRKSSPGAPPRLKTAWMLPSSLEEQTMSCGVAAKVTKLC